MVSRNVPEKPMARPKHRKGLWSPEEDQKLRDYVLKHGHGCWSSVPINAGLQRNGKSCRLRWINYLRPGLRKGNFTVEEEETILKLHNMLGNKWSQIAHNLPGRTDNEVKNYWHSYLKKRVAKAEETESLSKSSTSTPTLSFENTQSSPSSMNETTQISSFQSTQQAGMSLTARESQRSGLPKLFFAEWLSLDNEQQGSLTNAAEAVPSTGGFHHNSSFSGNLMKESLLNEGPFYGGLTDELFGLQFELEDQNSGSDQFVGSVFGDEFCSDFQMNNDVMFI